MFVNLFSWLQLKSTILAISENCKAYIATICVAYHIQKSDLNALNFQIKQQLLGPLLNGPINRYV